MGCFVDTLQLLSLEESRGQEDPLLAIQKDQSCRVKGEEVFIATGIGKANTSLELGLW